MNQILFIGSANSKKVDVVKELYGSQVDFEDELESESGLTFNDIQINTKYFSTKIGLWIDEFDDKDDILNVEKLRQWCDEMKSKEASEVREVLKGIVFVFNTSDEISYIKKSGELMSELVDMYFENFEGIKLALAVQHRTEEKLKPSLETLADLEDIWLMNGFEFVWLEEQTDSDDGHKVGKERVLEIFENNDWQNKTLPTSDLSREFDRKQDDKELDQMFARLLDDYDEDKEPEEKDIDYTELIAKLQSAKIDLGKLDDDKAKRELALDVIKDVIKHI